MSKRAFEFLILTVARTIEVRHALWSEVNSIQHCGPFPDKTENTADA